MYLIYLNLKWVVKQLSNLTDLKLRTYKVAQHLEKTEESFFNIINDLDKGFDNCSITALKN